MAIIFILLVSFVVWVTSWKVADSIPDGAFGIFLIDIILLTAQWT